MTEYIIMVALIAIATIGVVTVFGGNLRALFGATSESLTGAADVKPKTRSVADAMINKGLKAFGQNSQ